MNDNGLLQMQKEPTRESSILDLYLTNKPGLVKHNTTIPGISDHHMVVVDSDVKPSSTGNNQGKYSNSAKLTGPKYVRTLCFTTDFTTTGVLLNTMLTLC